MIAEVAEAYVLFIISLCAFHGAFWHHGRNCMALNFDVAAIRDF